MAKKLKDNKAVKKAGSLMAEFKAFISRGNVLDLAVGVIIGGAFSAIVTSIVSILMSLCTWGIPGGINGLVTVLPALNDGQTGLAGQCFNVSNLDTILKNLIDSSKIADLDAAKAYIASSYTIYGGLYVFNGAAIINWGAVINAVISFLIIAIVLFIVIKIVASIKKAKADLDAKALEAYYNKHPEERPAPVEEGVPEPTDHELLKGILLELQKKNKEENK